MHEAPLFYDRQLQVVTLGGTISFRREVPITSQDTWHEEVGEDGFLVRAIIHWPAGCNGLVAIRITQNGHQVVPKPPTPTSEGCQSWVALDSCVESFHIGRECKATDEIAVHVDNHDAGWPHAPSVIIEYKSKGEPKD